MHKRYTPKYPRTYNEFDSDELFHIINEIKKYQSRQWWKRNLPFAISLAIIIVYLLRGG